MIYKNPVVSGADGHDKTALNQGPHRSSRDHVYQQPENKFAMDFTMIILFPILISRNRAMYMESGIVVRHDDVPDIQMNDVIYHREVEKS